MPSLPAPYTEGPNASEQEQDAWDASISEFVTDLVLNKLSHETSAADLFADFNAPENQPLLFYYACSHLLRATREFSEAADHITRIAALFELLKDEGLKRDGPDGEGAFGHAIVFPKLRAILDDVPAPPGYQYDGVRFTLVSNPQYVKGDSFMAELAEYARNHEGLLRLWTLVGRLEAEYTLGAPGATSLLYHQAPVLLRALEDPLQRGVWETLWAAVLRCEEDMAFGRWGADAGPTVEVWLGPFKEAARTIAADERAPLEWRSRFAVIIDELEKERS